MRRWRGLKSMVVDAVEHGSRAVEKVHMQTARVPFAVLEAVPPLAVPAKGVHAIHDAAVTGVYGMIRLVNKVTGDVLDVVLDAVEKGKAEKGVAEKDGPPPAGTPPAGTPPAG
jgi:hypothetical protein